MADEIPEEAQAALQQIVDSGQAEWYLSGGTEKIEFTAIDFCTWYMAERQRIREQVAQEIDRVADEEDDGSSWGGGMLRAVQIARGES